MAGLVEPSGGRHLELRLAADAAAVRQMLRLERWEQAAEAAAALFNVALKAGYQASSKAVPLRALWRIGWGGGYLAGVRA